MEHETSAMIEATATVVAIEDELVVLETRRTSACSGCGAAGACGTSVLGEIFGQKSSLLRLQNSFDAEIGEQVIIGLEENALVTASLAVYLLPLVAMIFIALLALMIGLPDAVAGVLSLIALGGGLWLAGRLTKDNAARFTPTYLRRTPFSQAAKDCGI